MTVAEKADRLLDEVDGIELVDHEEIVAYKVKGNGGTYFVIVEMGKVEACSCPGGQFGVTCYHSVAVTKLLKKESKKR